MTLFIPEHEISLKAVRASGPGGQNVNKTSTKVQLRFVLAEVSFLTPWMRERLPILFPSRVTKAGEFVVECSETRDRLENERRVFQKLEEMLEQAAKRPKFRYATKPSYSSLQRKKEAKQKRSEKKKQRIFKGD